MILFWYILGLFVVQFLPVVVSHLRFKSHVKAAEKAIEGLKASTTRAQLEFYEDQYQAALERMLK